MKKLKKHKKIKLLLVATSGGHLTEGLRLIGDIPKTTLIVSTNESKRLSELKYKTYPLKVAKSRFVFFTANFIRLFSLVLKERPDWIITTGAECGLIAVIAGKILFRKTIFIETVTRYKNKTKAATLCYPLVTKFYVQHKEALPLFGKKAEYIGGLL